MPTTKIKKSDSQEWEMLTIVPIIGANNANPKGVTGPYTTTITLSDTSTIYTKDIHPANISDGSSNIYLHDGKIDEKSTPTKLKIVSNSGIIYIVQSNIDGQISIIETEPYIANNFEHAISLATNNINPYLSQISFLTDTPIAIKKIDSTEFNSGASRYICLPEPRGSMYPFSTALAGLSEYSTQLLAEYREARNASALPIYQLFCYFKIMDGYLSIKSKRSKEGLEPIKVSEIIKTGKYKGQKIGWLRDELNKKFRTDFAHFYLDGEKSKISPDNMENIYLAYEEISPAHDVARQVINNILKLDSEKII